MTGAEMIAAERRRQVEQEGWTPEHDDMHADSSMIDAAIAYACAEHPEMAGEMGAQLAWWPWAGTWWKPSKDPVRNLVKAGALLAAEIDRLQRARGIAAAGDLYDGGVEFFCGCRRWPGSWTPCREHRSDASRLQAEANARAEASSGPEPTPSGALDAQLRGRAQNLKEDGDLLTAALLLNAAEALEDFSLAVECPECDYQFTVWPEDELPGTGRKAERNG